jgi:hypothetical protein
MNWKKEISTSIIQQGSLFINIGDIYTIGVLYKSLTPSELTEEVANYKDKRQLQKGKEKKT